MSEPEETSPFKDWPGEKLVNRAFHHHNQPDLWASR